MGGDGAIEIGGVIGGGRGGTEPPEFWADRAGVGEGDRGGGGTLEDLPGDIQRKLRWADRGDSDAGLDGEGAISSRPHRHRRREAYVGGDRRWQFRRKVSGPTPEGGHCVIEGHVFAQVEAGLRPTGASRLLR